MVRLLRRTNEHKQVEELLSAYLDGQVSAAERAQIEQHLEWCAECAHSLATLRATVAAIRAMPHVRAPRSFTLPQTMAQKSHAAAWMYPLLRGAAVAAASLFAIIVAGDLLAHIVLQPFTAFRIAAPPAVESVTPEPLVAQESIATSVPRAAVPAVPSVSMERRPHQASTAQPSELTAAPVPPVKAAPQFTPTASGMVESARDAGLGALSGTLTPPREFAAAATGAPPLSTIQPTSAPLAETRIAASPQPLSARSDESVPHAQPQSSNIVRIFEGALAALAAVLGGATLIARRLNR